MYIDTEFEPLSADDAALAAMTDEEIHRVASERESMPQGDLPSLVTNLDRYLQ